MHMHAHTHTSAPSIRDHRFTSMAVLSNVRTYAKTYAMSKMVHAQQFRNGADNNIRNGGAGALHTPERRLQLCVDSTAPALTLLLAHVDHRRAAALSRLRFYRRPDIDVHGKPFDSAAYKRGNHGRADERPSSITV
jgi:hypothetical protein